MYNKRLLLESKRSILLTLIAALLSSLSLSLIPLSNGFEEGESHVLAYIIGVVFWLGFLIMLLSSHITKKKLARYREKLIANERMQKQRVGIISFSKSWKMWILYGLVLIGIVLLLTDIVIGWLPEWVTLPLLSLTLAAFEIHCILDGKNFKTYQIIKEGAKNETTH